MEQGLKEVLQGEEENYILPFFWLHGEEGGKLKEMMEAVYSSGIRAVCVESRPHPDFAGPAAKAVASGECDRGIVVCTTGIGVSITANKVRGIRCALLSDVMSARLTREHNDTNMMAIGAGVTGEMLALEIVDTWLNTAFSHAERHQRRIDKVMALEND